MIFIDAVTPSDYDCNLMFRWRNDPSVRDVSKNSGYIQWHDHEKWFRAKMVNGESSLVMLTIADIRIGVGRLDFDDDNGAEFSIYLNPELIGKKIGVEATRALLRHGFEGLDLYQIYGVTKFSNKAARAAFTKAGMVPHFDDTEFVRFTMVRHTWDLLSQPD